MSISRRTEVHAAEALRLLVVMDGKSSLASHQLSLDVMYNFVCQIFQLGVQGQAQYSWFFAINGYRSVVYTLVK